MAKFRDSAEEVLADPLAVSLWEYVSRYVNIRQLPEMHGELAIDFYQDLFERPERNEGKQARCKRFNENETYLHWPYGDRLVYLIRKYQSLPEDVRQYVVRAREANVFWRGDDIDFFRMVVKETLSYRKLNPVGKAEYRKNVFKRMREMI